MFQNEGYQYLSTEIRQAHAQQIARISEILKQHVVGFVKFFNFRRMNDGHLCLRFDYNWNANVDQGRSFTGVGYLPLDHLRDGFPVEQADAQPAEPSHAQKP